MMAPRSALSRQVISAVQRQFRYYSAPAERSVPPAKQKYVPSSGTYPKGFLAGSTHAGVKPSNTKYDDLALITSETACAAAALFTVNAFKAAPVQVSKKILQQSRGHNIRRVVINSGCANAVTGTGGMEDAEAMSRETSACFPKDSTNDTTNSTHEHGSNRVDRLDTLVMSTGVIGQRLPIEKITSKIPELHAALGDTHDHWLNTARAICTTDTFPKLISREFTLPSTPGVSYSIAGMTKGAGMIHPNMATLLSVICTDASISPAALKCLLRNANSTSFNSISIDGDTSTNDTVAIFANGAAAPEESSPIKVALRSHRGLVPRGLGEQSADYRAFQAVLNDFMRDLAKLVVRDGEGATKFVTIQVIGAVNDASAKDTAITIARSPLVKTALYGKDANWGRILCAVGYSRVGRATVVPGRTSVSFIPSDGSEELNLLVRGEPEQVDEDRAKTILEMEDLEIMVRLDDGPASDHVSEDRVPRDGTATVWTCDFSHEYVTINGDYRT